MADNNRNWGNQSHQSNQDWDRNRQRHSDDDSYSGENFGSYGNTGFGSQQAGQRSGSGYGSSGQSGSSYGRRDSQGGYGNMSNDYGQEYNRFQEGQYGAGGQGYDRGNRQNQYGSFGNSGYQGGGSYGSSGYGESYNRDADWNRHQGYGGNQGREDWNRGSMGSGYGGYEGGQGRSQYGSQYGNMNYGSQNYGNRDQSYNRGYENNRDNDRSWWDRAKDQVSSWFGDDDNDRGRRNQESANYRGKGPKDYRRSEERIREDVCDRLTEDPRVDASHIQIQIQGDEVILTGTVNTREEKRRAEDLVESISGVHNVENRIRVGRSDSGGSADQSRYGSSMHQYTGTTNQTGGIGNESGTTNEVIRNTTDDKSRNK